MDIEESIFSYVIAKNGASLDQSRISFEKSRKVLRTYLSCEERRGLLKRDLFQIKAPNMDTDEGTFPNIKPEIETPLDEREFYIEESKEHLKALCEGRRGLLKRDLFQIKAPNMDTDEDTFPNIKPEIVTLLDEREFYIEESKEHLKALLNDERICQFCTQICTHGFTPVKDLESDLTHDLYIPEENFSTTHEPVVCSSCFDSLNTQGRVLENHTDVQGEIISTSDEKDHLFYVKTEEIEIKSEEENFGNTPGCDVGPRGSQTGQNGRETDESAPALHNPTYKYSSERRTLQCVECDYTTRCQISLTRHLLLSHKDLWEVTLYECDRCNFKTKYKRALTRHQIVHKNIRDVQMYTCQVCGFQTKYKSYVTIHEKRKHQIVQISNIYQCDSCKFQTRYKGGLGLHKLIHKDNDENTMYKCDDCGMQTKYKSVLKNHKLRHKYIPKVLVHNSEISKRCFRQYKRRGQEQQ